MGCLGIPTRINKGTKYNSEEKIHYKYGNYSNSDAVANLIYYITRTRANETRANDLITYGAVGAGFLLGPEVMIQQFCYVQNAYKINQRKGKRMYHEVLNLYDCEAAGLAYLPEQFWAVGMECSQIYYQMGFQAAFAVHWEQGKRYHIHFAVNSISFANGRKWHTSLPEIHQREILFNQILFEHQRQARGKVSPVVFFDNKQ